MIEKNWGKKIKQLRIAAKMTQSDVNKKMKNPYNMMSQFENGKKMMTKEQRKLFFEVIGKPVDESIPVRAQAAGKGNVTVPQNAKGKIPKEKLLEPLKASVEVEPKSLPLKQKVRRSQKLSRIDNKATNNCTDVRKLAMSLIHNVLSILNDEDLVELALNLKKMDKSHPMQF